MIYVNLIFNLALLVALSIISGFIEKRKPAYRKWAALLQGLLFGGAAIIGMLRPLDLGGGLIFDGRSVVISLCALFFGPLAGGTAAVMAILFRIGLGGVGALMGVLVVLSSMGIGLFAHYRFKPESGELSVRNLYRMGLAVHVVMIALMLVLPSSVALATVKKIGLPVLLLYPLATVLGGKVLADQAFAAHFVDVLQKAKQNLEVTLQSIGEAVIATDVQGRVALMNPEAERLTGWKNADAIGKNLSEIFNVIDVNTRRRTGNPVEAVLRSGTVAVLANHSLLVARDGTERHITENASPIRQKSGEVTGVVLVFRDVTESYRTQAALRESEESYRRLFQDHAAVKMIVDPETGSILDVNKAAISYYGWPRERLVRMNIKEINTLPPEAIMQEMDKAKTLKRVHFEFQHRRAEGSVRDVEVFSSRILLAGKEALHSIVHDVTERKLVEEKLKQTDILLANIAERVPGVVYQYRLYPDGRSCFPYASPGMRQIYEVTPESVREDATPVFGRLHPEDYDRIVKDIRESSRTLNPFHCEFRVVLPQQGLRWRLCDARPQRMEDGGTLWYGIISDITELKKAEESLAQSEARYRNLIMNSPDAIFINQSERVILVNHACLKLFGAESAEDLIGRSPFELFHPDFHETMRARIHQLRDLGQSVPLLEEKIVRLDGKVVDVEVAAAPFPFEGTHAIHVILRDITERKLAEVERERLLAAIEQAGEAVCITDINGTIQYVNPAFETITGYSRADAVGENPRILKSGSQDDAFYRSLWKTIASGRTWKGQLINRRKTGELYTEDMTISPVCDATGCIANYVAVKHDITEKLQLTAQLMQAQKMESVGQLAGGVAHDFNNMLTVIIGHTQMLLQQTDAAQPAHADLGAILNAAERSARITRQLLAFARRQTIAPKVLDLNDTVEGMLKMLRRLIGEDINLVWSPGRNLWPVRMDPSQIDQVLANLCVNARDAIDGVGKITIETANVFLDKDFDNSLPDFVPGAYALLAVSDNGCGMDKQTLDKIFDPFFTTKAPGKGTGLGLSTVYGIVKQNNGLIRVYSEPGEGTTFKIYLPRETHQEMASQSDVREGAVPVGEETLLLVEDEKAILKLGKMVLEQLGYKVLTAETPELALQLAELHAGGIQLLITDVIMPGMNGKNLAEHLRLKYPDLKCLYMSGYTANVIAHHGVLDPGVHFIAKPFNVLDLASKVREVMDARA
ncbi:MAG: PAS domain S-box protein [Acidobacteriota bacterium]|nr:PAS domain S-box protein [Acidobacteriota bacterium]